MTHPCYIKNVDWFSWGWSKKNVRLKKKLRFSIPTILNFCSRKLQGKKIQNSRLKKTEWKVSPNLPMYLPCSADLCKYEDLQWYLMSNLLGLFSSLRSKANLSERGRKLKSYKIETVCEMAPWHNWQLSRQSLSLFCVQIDCSAHSSKIYNNGSNNRYPWKKETQL